MARTPSNTTIERVGGRIEDAAEKAAARGYAGDAQFLKAAGIAQLEAEKPSLIEKVDQSPLTMVGWMAVPIFAGLSKLGSGIGWMGDRLGVVGKPLRAIRTASAVPSSLLNARLSEMGSQARHGATWSSHLTGATRGHNAALKALGDAEWALNEGGVPLIRKGGKIGPEFSKLTAKLAEIKKHFGGLVTHEKFGAAEATEATLEALGGVGFLQDGGKPRANPIEFIDRVKAFDSRKAWKEFDDIAAPLEAKLKAEGNVNALKRLAKARAQFEGFTGKVSELRKAAETAATAIETSAERTAEFAVREKATADRIVGKASEKLGTFGEGVERSMQGGVLKYIGAGWVRDKYAGFKDSRAAAHSTKATAAQAEAATHFEAARQAVAGGGEHLTGVTKALDEHAQGFGRAATGNLASETKAASVAVATAVAEAPAINVEPIRNAASEARKALAAEQATIEATLKGDARKQALKAIEEKLSVLKKAEGSISNYAKATLKSHQFTASAAEKTASAGALRDLGATLRKLPGTIAGMQGHEVLNHGLYGLMQGTSLVRGYKSFSTPLAAMEHMVEGVTGKHVSAWQLHKEKLPESLKELHYWRTSLPGALSNAVAFGVNHYFMSPGSKSGGGFKALPFMLAIQGAAGLAGSLLAPKNALIDAYRKFTEAQQAGAEVPKVAVAQLLAAAKPNLSKLGIKDVSELTIADPALLAVSEQFVKKRMTAAQILKTIDTGELAKAFAAAQAEVKEQKKLRAEVDAKAPALTVANGEMKDIDRRSVAAHAKLAQKEQPVVGNHTLKENVRRVGKAAGMAAEVGLNMLD